MNAASANVLAGYRVIEHCEFISGPYAAMLLGDLGAEVIKVERPGRGDPFRSFEHGLYGPQFQAFNRNKKSLQLDLERPSERELMHELLESADVYIQNFRPGALERFGLDAPTVRAKHPRLVYCAITGFGRDGPYAHRPAYDTVGQALSGYLSMFVARDAPRIVGPATADSVTGLYAANGVLGALLARHATGEGRLVEVSMTAAMAHFSIEQYQRYFATGDVPGPSDRSRVSQSFAFRCADGKLLALHLSSPSKFWDGLLAAIESPQIASDPRFAERMDRVRHAEELEAALRPIFAGRPRGEWLQRLDRADVPHAPIHALDEALADPQMRHLDVEQRLHHPVEGEVRSIRSPLAFDGQRAGADMAAPPALNEHGAAIRAELAARRPDTERKP